MDHQTPFPFLRETLLFLSLTGVLIPLLQRFRINQVIGFLSIGIVVGPFGVGSFVDSYPWLSWVTIPRRQGVQALAELGVIFLMFLIGLELSLQRVWAMRRWVFGIGSAQVLLSSVLIGSLAFLFGNSAEVAVVLGLVLSLSSTAVVMQLLTQDRALATPLGQASFSILMLQDFAVVPLLIVVDLLSKSSSHGLLQELSVTALISVSVVTLIIMIGRKVVGPLFRAFAKQHQSEVFMALTLLVALSIAGATAMAGLSMALGAFLAGLLLAETEYKHEVEITIEPFKGLLMGLFFMSVGMGIDVREVAQEPLWIAISVMGLMLIKTVVAGGLMRWGGLTSGQALAGGMLLGQGGEFAFIVIGYASAAGLLSQSIGQFMLLVVSLSLFVTPLFARVGQVVGQRIDARRLPHGEDAPGSLAMPDASGQVVVIGYGRIGQLLGQVFQQQRIPFVAVEHNADVVAKLREAGLPIYFGNASRPELLHKLGLNNAACLVVTMDQPMAAKRVVQNARAQYPQLPIYARSHDEAHALELKQAGATHVVPETLEAGLLLTTFALQSVGLPDSDAHAVVAVERSRRTDYHA